MTCLKSLEFWIWFASLKGYIIDFDWVIPQTDVLFTDWVKWRLFGLHEHQHRML